VNLDIGVVGVGLPGQKRLDLAGVRLLPQFVQSGLGLTDDRLIALLLAESNQRDVVVEFAGNALEGGERELELLALAHQALRTAGVVPEAGMFRLAVKRG
jgi:hypothetical protein